MGLALRPIETPRILVVDDEPQITRVLSTVLLSRGYQVQTAADGDDALANLLDWNPGLVITDLAMPRLSGVELCRRIRMISRVPIIVLSVRSEHRAKAEALDSGADDYVTKPFGTEELLARIRATLRRAGPASAPDRSYLDAGDFRIGFDTRRVYVHGREIPLTPHEFDLFVYFARHPDRVIPQATLLAAVWDGTSKEQPSYLRVYMAQLRKKLEPDPTNPRYLITEPWAGYVFKPKG
jgi:two-component system KDP operon response regulator KdpE